MKFPMTTQNSKEKEILKRHYRKLQKLYWKSKRTDKDPDRFRRMQALSTLAKKRKKLSTPLPSKHNPARAG